MAEKTVERRICTAEKPYDAKNPDHKGFWRHPDAVAVGDQRDGWPAGDLQDFECPHCGLRFTMELPQ